MNSQHKNLVGRYPAAWHLDGGREFTRFKSWATHEDRGIRIQISPPRTPEANGLSERHGGLINQMARTIMIDSGLPGYLWPCAVKLSAQIRNRLPPKEGDPKKTPAFLYRTFYNLPNPNDSLDVLRVFGCRAYVHIPAEDRTRSQKLNPRASIGYLVGFDGDHGHVYHVWFPDSDKVKRSRDVTFDETKTYRTDRKDPDMQKQLPLTPEAGGSIQLGEILAGSNEISTPRRAIEASTEEDVITGRVRTISNTAVPTTTLLLESLEDPHAYDTANTKYSAQDHRLPEAQPIEAPTEEPQSLLRSGRPYGNAALAAPAENTAIPRLKHHEVVIPNTYREAMKSPLALYWKEAMDTQIDKINRMDTYRIVKPPSGARIIPGKWVYDLKLDDAGFVTQFRARWVVCGNRQMPGVDYDESSAPVASEVALKLFLTHVALKRLHCEQWDVVSAYLHAMIQGKQVLMKQPTGYHEGSEDQVCELNRALYGLRQAAFLRHQTFTNRLSEIGFKPLRNDPCIYQKGDVILVIFVDDSAVAAPRQEDLAELKQHLSQAFGLKELGEPKVFLGCNLKRDYEARTILLSQPAYVEESLIAAGMQESSGSTIPMTPSYRRLDRASMTSQVADTAEYRTPCRAYQLARHKDASRPPPRDLPPTTKTPGTPCGRHEGPETRLPISNQQPRTRHPARSGPHEGYRGVRRFIPRRPRRRQINGGIRHLLRRIADIVGLTQTKPRCDLLNRCRVLRVR